MSLAPFLYAFAAGAISAFNPCGFVLLPTYAASFLAEDGGSSSLRRLARVSGAMSAGFFTVFAFAGILVGAAGVAVPATLPRILVLMVAALMAVMGLLLLSGRSLPGLRLSIGSSRTSYSYGLAYAAASLACALPVFLSAVVFSFSRSGGFLAGVWASVGYAAGMSFAVLGTLAAVSYAGAGVVGRLRSSAQYFSRVAGFLLVAGSALLVARETLGLRALDLAAGTLQGSPAALTVALVVLSGVGFAVRRMSGRGLLRDRKDAG